MIPTITRFKTSTEFIEASTKFILNEALKAIEAKGSFTLILSGGSTPKKIYNMLSSSVYKEQFPWDKTFFFLGDERLLSSKDSNSNIFMLQQTLFIDNTVEEKNKILPNIDLNSPELSVKNYERKLYEFFEDKDITIDLTLLGVGSDGHTASLFPEEFNHWIENENLIIKTLQPCGNPSINRISASLKLLNSSKTILLLAVGKEKTGIINSILEDIKNQTNQLRSPLAEIKPLKNYHWFIN